MLIYPWYRAQGVGFRVNLHILVALVRHIPAIEYKIFPKCQYDAIVLHKMITEYICEYALAMMQINGQQFTLEYRVVRL